MIASNRPTWAINLAHTLKGMALTAHEIDIVVERFCHFAKVGDDNARYLRAAIEGKTKVITTISVNTRSRTPLSIERDVRWFEADSDVAFINFLASRKEGDPAHIIIDLTSALADRG